MSSRSARRRRRSKMRLEANDKQIRLVAATGEVSFSAAPGEGEASGPPTFEIQAYNGGAMKPSYQFWPTPVVVDLAGLEADNNIPILLDHQSDQIIGQATKVKITKGAEGGIVLSGVITGDPGDKNDPAGKVVGHAKRGFNWKASIGINPSRYERVNEGQSVMVNGRQFNGPLYVLRAGTLDETSLLSVGADRTTTAKIAAQGAKESDMDFHEWLKALGFDPQELNDTQRDKLLAKFKAETGSKNAGPPTDDDKKRKADDETKKLDATGIGSRLHRTKQMIELHRSLETIAATALEVSPHLVDEIEAELNAAKQNELTPEMFKWKIDVLCARAPDNSLRSRTDNLGDPEHRSKLIEAALYLSCGLSAPEKHFDERILEAAEKKWPYRLSLGEMLRLAARMNGFGELTHRNPEPLLEAVFPARGMRAAGQSTVDVSGILSNLANKALVDHFNAVDNAWRSIAAIRPVTDFKQITSYSLTGDLTFIEVPPGGEIKHGTLGEESYSNQAKTYALMLAIDRQSIVNDDLGAFNTVLRRLGRGGALKLNSVFWSLFMNNAAIFTAARGNYDEGTDTALSLSALTAAETLFLNQTDPNGNPLGLMPARLVVPTSLKRTALQLMNSVEVRTETPTTGAASVQYGTRNTFQGDYQVVSTPYMSNSNFTGYSALAWYLLANPADVAVIEACFLNGRETPTVESAQADFNILGIQMRGFFDFGVGIQEYRAGVKMLGEAE